MKETAILFDHDGTLVDSIQAVVITTNMSLKKNGFNECTTEEITYGMNYPTFERFRLHSDSEDDGKVMQMTADFYSFLHSDGLQYLKVFPGIQDCLDEFAKSGYSMGIVSNSQGMFVRKAAAHLHYAYDLAIILGEENVEAPKPAPGGLIQACAGLAAEPENCWYIGDAPSDHKAAKAAGMKSGLVAWGANTENVLNACGADAVFKTPAELKKFFL